MRLGSKPIGYFLLAMAACRRAPRPERTAAEAVQQFHQGLTAGHYQEVCGSASPDAFVGITGLACPEYLAYVHERLGGVKQAQRTQPPAIEARVGKPARVVLEYQTRYERGEAREHFEWRISESGVTLTSYRIVTLALTN